MTRTSGFVIAALLLAATAVLDAQTPQAAKSFIAGRAGANIQAAEDGENGTSIGGGLSGAFFIGPQWALELEGWIPAFIEQDGKQFRDLLFSVSALRRFGSGRVEPYFLAGLTLARVQVKSSFGDSSNGYSYAQVGAGVAISLSERVAVAPEVRANIGVTSNIARPALALIYRFP